MAGISDAFERAQMVSVTLDKVVSPGFQMVSSTARPNLISLLQPANVLLAMVALAYS